MQTEPSFTLSNCTGLNTTGGGANTSSNNSVWSGGSVTYTPYKWTSFYPYYAPDKTRQAFLIIKTLEERGLIKLSSVKKFMSLVDEIYKLL